MTSKDSHSQEYEVTDHDQIVPVASQGLLISQILERLEALEGTVAELREENRQLREEVDALRRDHDDHRETVGREIASDRRRITALETPAPAPRERTAAVTEEHQNHVKALLLREPTHRLKIKDIAPRLGVTRQQTWNIVRGMERRRVVNIINDPHHRQRKIIELHQQIGTFSNY